MWNYKRGFNISFIFNKVTIVLATQKQISQEDLDAFPSDLFNKKRETQGRKDREIIIMSMKNKVDTTKLWPNWPNLNYNRLSINYTDNIFAVSCHSDKNNININSDLYPAVSEMNMNLPFTKKKVIADKSSISVQSNNTSTTNIPNNSDSKETPNEAINSTSSTIEDQIQTGTNENTSTEETNSVPEIPSNNSSEQSEAVQPEAVQSEAVQSEALVSQPSTEPSSGSSSENGISVPTASSEATPDASSSTPESPKIIDSTNEQQPNPAPSRVQSKSKKSRKPARIENHRVQVKNRKKAASTEDDSWLPDSSRMSISELESVN